MRVKVRFFASHRETVRMSLEYYELPESVVLADLIKMVYERHPKLDLKGAAFAVNKRISPPSMPLSEGDEVAILPPVSGG